MWAERRFAVPPKAEALAQFSFPDPAVSSWSVALGQGSVKQCRLVSFFWPAQACSCQVTWLSLAFSHALLNFRERSWVQ